MSRRPAAALVLFAACGSAPQPVEPPRTEETSPARITLPAPSPRVGDRSTVEREHFATFQPPDMAGPITVEQRSRHVVIVTAVDGDTIRGFRVDVEEQGQVIRGGGEEQGGQTPASGKSYVVTVDAAGSSDVTDVQGTSVTDEEEQAVEGLIDTTPPVIERALAGREMSTGQTIVLPPASLELLGGGGTRTQRYELTLQSFGQADALFAFRTDAVNDPPASVARIEMSGTRRYDLDRTRLLEEQFTMVTFGAPGNAVDRVDQRGTVRITYDP